MYTLDISAALDGAEVYTVPLPTTDLTTAIKLAADIVAALCGVADDTYSTLAYDVRLYHCGDNVRYTCVWAAPDTTREATSYAYRWVAE